MAASDLIDAATGMRFGRWVFIIACHMILCQKMTKLREILRNVKLRVNRMLDHKTTLFTDGTDSFGTEFIKLTFENFETNNPWISCEEIIEWFELNKKSDRQNLT